MSATPLTDAYLASRCKGENKQSWVEFAQSLEKKMMTAELAAALHMNAASQLADMVVEEVLKPISGSS